MMDKDQFREEAVAPRNQTMGMLTMGVAWVTMIISGLAGVIWLQGTMMTFAQEGVGAGIVSLVLALVMIGIAVLIFLFKDRLRTEYEYAFTNGMLDFAAVYNNKKRKNLGTMNLKNIKACGKVASGAFNRYINQPGIQRHNWFANRDGDLFFIYYEKDSKKNIIILEPSEEMAALIRGAVPRGSYEIN